MQKLEDDFDLYTEVSSKGTLNFYDEDPKTYKKKHNHTWSYFIVPRYTITSTGKVVKNKVKSSSTFQKSAVASTLFKLPEFVLPEDYIPAFEILHKLILATEVNKWRQRIRKNPTVLTQAPTVVLNKINPKISKISKIGIFD